MILKCILHKHFATIFSKEHKNMTENTIAKPLTPEEIQKSEDYIKEQVSKLSDEQKEQIVNILGPVLSKFSDTAKEAELAIKEPIQSVASTAKEINIKMAELLSRIKFSDFLSKAIPLKDIKIPEYKGVEIERYRRLRHYKAKEIANLIGVDESTMSKYASGQIDIPSSKLLYLSTILNVSTDLLLKKDARTLKEGYLTKNIPLYQFDYKTGKPIKSSRNYLLDENLKDVKDEIKIIKYPNPIYELNLPANSILIVSEGNAALTNGINKRIAVHMIDKNKDGSVSEYFSYVSPIQGENMDYSSATNYNYTRNGVQLTTNLKTIMSKVDAVIHKVIIDF